MQTKVCNIQAPFVFYPVSSLFCFTNHFKFNFNHDDYFYVATLFLNLILSMIMIEHYSNF